MKNLFIKIILSTILTLTANLLADTLIIDPNGLGDYTTIQEGINNSTGGDTIIVQRCHVIMKCLKI